MAELQRIRVNELVRPVEGASPRGFASVARAGGEIAQTSRFLQGKAEDAFAFVENQLGDLAASSVSLAKAEREYQFNVDGQQLTLRDKNHVVRPFIPPGISVFDQKYRKAVQTQYENEVETGGRAFLTQLAIDNNNDPVKFLKLAEQYIGATTESVGLDTKSKLWNDLTRSSTAMYHALSQQKAAKDYRNAVRTSVAEIELGYRDLSRMANAGLTALQVTPEGVVDNKDIVSAVRRTLTGIYRQVELGEYSEPMAELEAKRVFDLWAVEQVQGQMTSEHDRLVRTGLKNEALQAALETHLQKLMSGDTRVMYPEFNRQTGEVKLRPRAIGDIVGADQLPKLQQGLRTLTRAYQEVATQHRQIQTAGEIQSNLEWDARNAVNRATGKGPIDSQDEIASRMAGLSPAGVVDFKERVTRNQALMDAEQRRTADKVQAEHLLPHLKATFLALGDSAAVRQAFPELFTHSTLENLEERVESLGQREQTLRSWIAAGQTVLTQGQREVKILNDISGRIQDVMTGLAPRPLTFDMALLRNNAVNFEGGWRNPNWVEAFTTGSRYDTPELTAVVPLSVWQGLRGFLQGQQGWDENGMRQAQQLATLIVKNPMLKDQAGASWAMGESGIRALHYLAASANVGKLLSDPKEMERLNRIMSDQKIAEPMSMLNPEQRRDFYKTVDEVFKEVGGDVPQQLRSDILEHLSATMEYHGADKALIKGTVEGYTRRLIEEGSYGPSIRTIPLGGPRNTDEKRWAYAPIELRYQDNKWLDAQLTGIGRRLTNKLDDSNVPQGLELRFSGRKQNAWVYPVIEGGKLSYGISMVTQDTREGERPNLVPVVTGARKPFTFDLDSQWESHKQLQSAEMMEKLMRQHQQIVRRKPEVSYWGGQ